MSPFVLSHHAQETRPIKPTSPTRRGDEKWVEWAALSLLYTILIIREIRRTLWYDELITFYIAKAPTLPDLLYLMRRWDLSPPTLHLLAHLSMSLVGENAIGARLPSVVEFYFASLGLFAYSQRKLGTECASLAVLLLWYSPFFQYATEARSYALLAMFFSALLFCWDAAVTEPATHRKEACWGIAFSTSGVIASHIFAPMVLAPFWVAEGVRMMQRRKIDYQVWAALLLPVLGVLAYIPFFRSYTSLIYPLPFQAAPRKMAVFFWHATPGIWLKLLIGASILLAFWRTARPGLQMLRRFRTIDVALFAALLAQPILLNLILMWGHGAFWDRYCITTALGLYICIAGLLGMALRFHRVAVSVVALVLACLILVQRVPHPLYDNLTNSAPAGSSATLTQLKPNLPLVAASGLTFVEMNYNERPVLLSRLYYLTDRAAATRFAHANLFEALDDLKNDFALTGTVEPYARFVKQHEHFLVLGTSNYPEDWLLRKLAADNAKILQVAECKLPYKDSQIYEVTIPGSVPSP